MGKVRETGAIEAAQNKAFIRIAQIGLRSRGLVQTWQHVADDPPRPITTAREPKRVEAGIIRHFDEGIGAHGI